MAKKEYAVKTTPGAAAKSEANKQLAVVRNQQSNALASMLAKPEDSKATAKLVRRGMPTMIKPESVPVNSVIEATIVAILGSPKKSIKGLILHLRHESGTEFTFPVTGSIQQALAPGTKGDEAALRLQLDKEVGKTIVLKRLPSVENAEYKKQMFIFDVFTSEA